MKKGRIATLFALVVLTTNILLQPSLVIATEIAASEPSPTTATTSDSTASNEVAPATNKKQEAPNASLSETATATNDSDTMIKPRITYSANNGTNAGTIFNDQIAEGGSYTVRSVGTAAGQLNFTAPTPASQLFDGWNTASDGSGTSFAAGTTSDSWPYTSDTILYAQWAKASTLYFSANGTSGAAMPASQFNKVGTGITVPEIPNGLTTTTPHATVGTVWNTRSDGTGTDYAPGSIFTLTDANTSLYIKIVADPVDANATLTFDLNGGDPSSDSNITNGMKTVIDDNYQITLPATKPTRPGYQFAYWRINNGNYQPNAKVTVKYSTTATAQWTAMTTITFDAGVPSGSSDKIEGLPSNTTVVSNGGQYTVPGNIPVRTSSDGNYYNFKGWLLNGVTTVMPNGSSSLNNNAPGSLNFVAQWEVSDATTKYVVSFNGNGNTSGSTPFAYKTVDKGAAITIPGAGTLKRTNYTFVGWSDGTTVYEEGESYTPTENKTLLAEWVATTTYGAIKFDGQSKAGSNPQTITGVIGDYVTLPDIPNDNTPPQEDYQFWGWATSKNATVPDYYAENSYVLSKGVTTLYGVWSPTSAKYWAQIKLSKGSATGTYPDDYSGNNVYNLSSADDTYSFKVPSASGLNYTGYAFKGWKYSKDSKIYQPGDTIILSDISSTKNPGTLTAQWDPITYTISYDPGDATGGAVPTTVPTVVSYGNSYTVLPNSAMLVKTGYTFIGWTDGETIYTPGQNLAPTTDVVLKPYWKANPAGGGGSGTVNQAKIMYVALESGVTGTLPDSVSIPADFSTSYTVAEPNADFSYPGHTFAGWYILDAKGKQVDYSPGSTFVVYQDMIFYAKWQAENVKPDNSYTLSFNGNGNTSGLVPGTQYVKQSSSTLLPSNNTLVKNEYVDNNASTGTIETNPYLFVGWSTNKAAKAGDPDVLPAGTAITPTADTVYYAIWDIKNRDVTLRYDGNGNTGGSVPASVTVPRYDEVKIDGADAGSSLTKVVTDATGTKSYIFGGWSTQSGTDYFTGKTMSVAADTTLYAKWVPTASTQLARIIYVGNGNDSGDYIRYDDTNAATYTIKTQGNMARSGYMFTGWNTAADGSGTAYNSSDLVQTKDHTSLILYAQWKQVDPANIYVVYNGNGNTAGTVPETIVSQKNKAVTLASSNTINTLGLAKTGYMFAGWAANVAATGTMYVAGNDYTFNQNTILYAIWAEDGNYIATSSKVTYNPNYDGTTGSYTVEGAVDATADVDGTTVLHGHKIVANQKNGGAYLGEDYTIASYPTTGFAARPNYQFTGWATDPTATKAAYTAEQLVNLKKTTMDLYAVWTPGNYTITYDKNTGTGTMDAQQVTYDAQTALSLNSFTKAGYTFTGWNTKEDGSGTAYADQASVKNLTTADNNLTLYAQWQANDNTIQFDANGGLTTQPSLTKKTDEQVDLTTVPDATRDGYHFDGWYTEKTGDTKMPANLIVPDGGVTYYAHWTANHYTIAYNANNGNGTMNNQTFTYDVAQQLSKNSFTRDGYQFIEWNTKADGTGTPFADQASVSNLTANAGDTIPLYAQWAAATDNPIKFDANGGTTAQPTLLKTTDEVLDLSTVLGATRTGYTFEGWYTEAIGGTIMPASLRVPAGGVTYYAHWSANHYTVSFNANQGDGTMVDQLFTYDQTQSLTKNSYMRVGYQFSGWNTKADGTGTSYTDNELITNLTNTANGKVTLYAQWKATTYVVIFDPNQGQGTMNNQSFTYDVKQALTKNTFTRTGYTFVGWNTKQDGTGKMYTDEESVMNLTFGTGKQLTSNVKLTSDEAGQVTLYAQWVAHHYTVSYNANVPKAGTLLQGMMNDQTFLYDASQTLAQNMYTLAGYNFKGWNTTALNTGDFYQDGALVKNLTADAMGHVTLYAQWEAQMNTITFDPMGGTTTQTTITKPTDALVDLSTVATATRAGYTFAGWYTSKEGTEKIPTNLAMPAGGVTYYAHWIPLANEDPTNNHLPKTGTKNTGSNTKNTLPQTGETATITLFLWGIFLFGTACFLLDFRKRKQ